MLECVVSTALQFSILDQSSFCTDEYFEVCVGGAAGGGWGKNGGDEVDKVEGR